MFTTVTEYNHALAKDHQDRAKLFYHNAQEAYDDEFNLNFIGSGLTDLLEESAMWQRKAAAHSLAARTYLGIKERDYDHC